MIVGLTVYALFIWLRDTGWMTSADDTLPILAALPIFIWIGSPWHFRTTTHTYSKKGLAAFALLFLLGILLNLTFLLALSWTALLWCWLDATIEPDPSRPLPKLLVLPLLAFPWISLDLDRLGWWFRLTGAWATAHLFHLFGFYVELEGTNILINTMLINVEVACAGLNTLQSMLIAGTVVAYIILGDSKKFWWNLPLLFLMAWVANTLRIIATSLTALYISPEFARSAFHQISGWIILILMFCLCWLLFACQRRKS